MQFSTLLIATMAVFAPMIPTVFACNQGQDCCWGGEAGGWKGCMNQHGNFLIEDRNDRCETLKPDWCSNNGVSEAQCVSIPPNSIAGESVELTRVQ
ncbi:hypothetical protein VTL71DRAFT_6035 [Oculimacula yallundae]|uniref:Uncharacterized protein n=1 Tax=Oculimacula yallundae TaxID=86028 RepID=A0ABR4C1S5_9HELO